MGDSGHHKFRIIPCPNCRAPCVDLQFETESGWETIFSCAGDVEGAIGQLDGIRANIDWEIERARAHGPQDPTESDREWAEYRNWMKTLPKETGAP